jgi:hypothetical protein
MVMKVAVAAVWEALVRMRNVYPNAVVVAMDLGVPVQIMMTIIIPAIFVVGQHRREIV